MIQSSNNFRFRQAWRRCTERSSSPPRECIAQLCRISCQMIGRRSSRIILIESQIILHSHQKCRQLIESMKTGAASAIEN